MTAEECKAYAETHKDFNEYIDRFCKDKKIIRDDGVYCLKMIQLVAEDYKKKEGA